MSFKLLINRVHLLLSLSHISYISMDVLIMLHLLSKQYLGSMVLKVVDRDLQIFKQQCSKVLLLRFSKFFLAVFYLVNDNSLSSCGSKQSHIIKQVYNFLPRFILILKIIEKKSDIWHVR